MMLWKTPTAAGSSEDDIEGSPLGTCFQLFSNSGFQTHIKLPPISGTVSHFKNILTVAQEPFPCDNCHMSSLWNTILQIFSLFLSLSFNSFIYMTIFKATKIKAFRIQFPFWFYKMELQLVENTRLHIAVLVPIGLNVNLVPCKVISFQGRRFTFLLQNVSFPHLLKMK